MKYFLVGLTITLGAVIWYEYKFTSGTAKSSPSNQNSSMIDINTPPDFVDYPVVVNSSTTATYPSIDLSSHPLGRKYASAISAANATPPDFAGKYSLVTWGCGTMCQTGAIIDRERGGDRC